jgi:enterochelin esterase family protein
MGEAIVVMPDCMTRYGGSQYVDSAATGPYGRYTAVEVVEWADASFRTIPSRDARGVFGKSSGGYGSFRMAVDFPSVFSAFACHSGDAAFEYCYLREFGDVLRFFWHRDMKPRQFLDGFRDIPPHERGDQFHAVLNEMAMASCYSPNPSSELGFDLPFSLEDGGIDDAVWDRWLANDPVRMIEHSLEALRSQRLIYVDCGTKDEWYLDVGARWMTAKMRAAGLEVVHEEFDAGHMNIPYRYDVSLPLITKALVGPEG